MDSFENIVRVLLERENLWVRQSERVNLTKKEKRLVGKPSLPRAELDLVALDFARNQITVVEAKSYLDSPGVSLAEITAHHDVLQGHYKLFTCDQYRDIVFSRLKTEYRSKGLANGSTRFRLGLAAGKVRAGGTEELRAYFDQRNWFFWGPEDIKSRVRQLAETKYEDDPVIMTAKLLER